MQRLRLTCQTGCFQQQKSSVRIHKLANFYLVQLFTVNSIKTTIEKAVKGTFKKEAQGLFHAILCCCQMMEFSQLTCKFA